MSSLTSRDDVEDAAFRAGIRDPRKLRQLMQVVDTYAYALTRKMSGVTEEIILESSQRGKPGAYLCRNCNERMALDCFPLEKQENPTLPYDCLPCGGADRKTYRCPECEQDKNLGEFPERKQKSPRVYTPCSYCDARKITVADSRGHDTRSH